MDERPHVLVVGGDYSYYKPFTSLGEYTENENDIGRKSIALVVFTGGADVSPSLYNEKKISNCWPDPQRDEYEVKVFKKVKDAGLKMFGICRGSQFLCVMAGGKLVQHLNRHAGQDHKITTRDGRILKVNSLHHQMQVPPDDAVLIAWSSEKHSDVYLPKGFVPEREVECVYYPSIKAVGVQYHPEMMGVKEAGFSYTRELAEKLINNPDSLLADQTVNSSDGERTVYDSGIIPHSED